MTNIVCCAELCVRQRSRTNDGEKTNHQEAAETKLAGSQESVLVTNEAQKPWRRMPTPEEWDSLWKNQADGVSDTQDSPSNPIDGDVPNKQQN